MKDRIPESGGLTIRVRRLVLALFIVPLFNNLVFLLLPIFRESMRPRDFASSLISETGVAILSAWPGWLTFLVLGVPTIYLLARMHRIGFLLFAVLGALYTTLPWFVLQPQRPPNRKVLDLVPSFAVIGLANGILTRLIVFGRRRN